MLPSGNKERGGYNAALPSRHSTTDWFTAVWDPVGGGRGPGGSGQTCVFGATIISDGLTGGFFFFSFLLFLFPSSC